MKSIKINICYIYISLWMLYYLQEMLMITGIIAQVFFMVLMLMSFYAFFQVNINYRTCPYLKWLNVMLIILSVYGIIPIIGGWYLVGNIPGASWLSYAYLQKLYMSILPIYAFYFFTLKKKIRSDNLIIIYLLLVAFSSLMYYQNLHVETERLGREEITNNAGYFFVPLIPMLLIVKMKDLWKYLSLIAVLLFLILAMKRGAILTGSVMMVLFIFHHLKKVSLKRFCYILILSAIVVIVAYQFAINFYDSSSHFQYRVEQTTSGYTSHRDEIYTSYFEYFVTRTSPLEFLIGNGANATKVLLGQYAHNDWLEFAINEGVLGVIIYLVYWIVFIWEWKNFEGDMECKQTLGDVILAYFLIALYSMSFANMPIAATLCIGYCLANNCLGHQLKRLKKRVK